MKTTTTIPTRSGMNLRVETSPAGEELEITFQAPSGKPCLLHWGVLSPGHENWTLPPQSHWPPGTQAFGEKAVQTPFSRQNGQTQVVICLDSPPANASLEFVLFFPDEKQWDNNGGQNYRVPLLKAGPGAPNLLETLRREAGAAQICFERVFDLDDRRQLAVGVTKTETGYRVLALSDLPSPLLLHWGVARRSPHEWLLPPESALGSGVIVAQYNAVQTPFAACDGFNSVQIEFPEAEAPMGIQFVLRQSADPGRWINCRGGNFYVPVRAVPSAPAVLDASTLGSLADEIVRAEMTHNSWTLMHRFNLCYDLLDRARTGTALGNLDGLALLYVWLRFSAIRQLTWQRNYNTKPSELAHAQGRLTAKLAELCRSDSAGRPLLRLMLTTIGRGGEGQRIRDEILNIMHRHHVKEVTGHFLEEWHQKLHNNTTPDDVVICEAYLEFLRTNGNRDRFYQVLAEGGVSRERLESFERPIRTAPDFAPHIKDGLIQDFTHFLGILKAAHSGTDFETALHAARGFLDSGLQGRLDWIAGHRNDGVEGLVALVDQITEARRHLSNLLHQSAGLRENLYLDLALERLLRAAVERNLHQRPGGGPLADLIARVLENVTLSYEDRELATCLAHWERLQTLPRLGPEWSLHAKSVTDRIGRALGAWTDRFYQLLQPKAECLGAGFKAEPWTISLFSEEVVRGSSLGFVLSMLLHQLDPLLRQAAHLGAWQIISRGRGAGKVEVVDSLRSIQRTRFAGPVVVVAGQVMGDEEIPENVTAVIGPDVTDIVSHVAVRARNANVLFASCHDAELLERLRSLKGRHIALEVNAGGDVLIEETTAVSAPTTAKRGRPALTPRRFTNYAIALDEFNERWVGAKSCHQARLRGTLPSWIGLPASAAVPFGVFEKLLSLELNRDVAERYRKLVNGVGDGSAEALETLRQTVLSLGAPDEFKSSLHDALSRAGLPVPGDWEKAWNRIKQVWASKWNDRAFLSRQRLGLPHADLFMAVLIQAVVPADYAFVIHTVNPATGNANELFAEVVLGLGETLVGNYPGRALSFVSEKTTGQQTLLSFPGKSAALYGSGLIFRSDSNGEDLAGYAGAGLYDSVLVEEPRRADADYSQEPLVWDEPFRHGLLAAIARIGLEVERVCGSPQDIEGAVAGGRYYVVQTRPQVGIA